MRRVMAGPRRSAGEGPARSRDAVADAAVTVIATERSSFFSALRAALPGFSVTVAVPSAPIVAFVVARTDDFSLSLRARCSETRQLDGHGGAPARPVTRERSRPAGDRLGLRGRASAG